MSVGYYFHPGTLTTDQYDSIFNRLEAAGASKPKGRQFHSCFSEGPTLAIYDIWDSEADFEAFGATLMPILADLGIDVGQPAIVPIHNVIYGQ